MRLDHQGAPVGIDHGMTLPALDLLALDLLAGIVAAWSAGLRGLDALAVNHRRRRESYVRWGTLALLADGHVLVEGAPGLAKTRSIVALSRAIACDEKRIQFTPDLLPGDLTGTEVWRPEEGSFTFQRGPLFHNLILADEINRAPAKVQSALLEAMAERQITVGGETYKLPKLFMVMATQNPIEQEGTLTGTAPIPVITSRSGR